LIRVFIAIVFKIFTTPIACQRSSSMSLRRESKVETDNEKHNKWLLKKSAEYFVKHLQKSLRHCEGHRQLVKQMKDACHDSREWQVASCPCPHGIGSLQPRGRAPPACKHVVVKMLNEACAYLDQMVADIKFDATFSRERAKMWYVSAMQTGDVPEPALCAEPADTPGESTHTSAGCHEERNCALLREAAMRILLDIPSTLQHEKRRRQLLQSLDTSYTMSERLHVSWCRCRDPSDHPMFFGCKHDVAKQLYFVSNVFRERELKLAKQIEQHRAQAFAWWVAAGGLLCVPEPSL